MTRRLLSLLVLLLICAGPAHGQEAGQIFPGFSTRDLDRLVAGTQAAFHVPGVAVAVIRDGKVVLAKGYGIRKAGDPAPVDSLTQFAIGSNTKAFTTAALSILVHAGKLGWEDPVWEHMPDFALADPYLTRAFIVTDLLTHHSGMEIGAGDLMLFEGSQFTRREVVDRLRYMPFTAPFRLNYAYNNLLYVTAGRLLEEVSGESWERFVQDRIMTPAGMRACTPAPHAPEPGEDRAAGHDVENGAARPVPWDNLPAVAPAGGIECSLDGMTHWARMLLGHGSLDGRVILAPDQVDTLWAPHALLPLPDYAAKTGTHFRAYGLGWFMEDFFGHKRIWHTGTIQNSTSYVSFLPEENMAVVVLTNQDDHHAPYTIATTVSAAALGHRETDWLAYFREDEAASDAARRKRAEDTGPGSRARPFVTLSDSELQAYAGTYHDVWRGDATVTLSPQGLRMRFARSATLAGTLHPLPHDLFLIRWDNDSDDAYVQFHRDMTGKIASISMALLEPDFSFDVQDLDLKRMR
ncbi:serine hydrolase [Acidomonas methanolica]|uniref:serine hydrolase n=1 Tax=Acidomonas methanolica TaxID=437 RepID=UPI00211A5B07|nr:serine hydrolase [Acidomonas methanolica]MCQ9156227.1 serine hydrolase [Acidomonas methanolica]